MSDAPHLSPGLTAAHEAPDRNLALELVRVTESAALASSRWVGRGDKIGADDHVMLILDTFNDKRRALVFEAANI